MNPNINAGTSSNGQLASTSRGGIAKKTKYIFLTVIIIFMVICLLLAIFVINSNNAEDSDETVSAVEIDDHYVPQYPVNVTKSQLVGTWICEDDLGTFFFSEDDTYQLVSKLDSDDYVIRGTFKYRPELGLLRLYAQSVKIGKEEKVENEGSEEPPAEEYALTSTGSKLLFYSGDELLYRCEAKK